MKRLYLLSVFIPIAVGLDLAHASDTLIFAASALGIMPTALLMSQATEALAERSGPGIGAILNVTFGNAPELIIAFFALLEGLQEVVKASIVGSVIGNVLLVLGASMFIGGLRRETQYFNRTAAYAQAGALLLAVLALILPAVFQLVHGGGLPAVTEESHNFATDVEQLSLGVALVLMATYVGALIFSLKTHKQLFNPDAEHAAEDTWSVRKALGLLALAGVLVGVMSEILVGSIAGASESVGLSPFFIGVVVVAIVGNAAEHFVAIIVAHKNKMDLAVNIALGSSAQIAMFVAPVLVILSFFFGEHPMSLVFNGFELVALISAVLIANFVTSEGESNWFEGAQLLAVYLALGLMFFFA